MRTMIISLIVVSIFISIFYISNYQSDPSQNTDNIPKINNSNEYFTNQALNSSIDSKINNNDHFELNSLESMKNNKVITPHSDSKTIKDENRIEKNDIPISKTPDVLEYKKSSHHNSEFLSWQKSHVKDVEEVINGMAPEIHAEIITEKVKENNDFFNQKEILQDPIIDEIWVQEIEMQIKDVINQHENNALVDLRKLTCKQLVCEFTGIELETNSWQPIEISIILHLLKNNVKIKEQERKSIKFDFEGELYFYTLIQFEQ